MKRTDLEKTNRVNFREMMFALSMPGSIKSIMPLYKSGLLALANCVLYNEVSFFYTGDEDISLIEAITNSKKETINNADYIFSDTLNTSLLLDAKSGDHLNPDYSATLIFTCKDFKQTKVRLSGPGIDGSKNLTLPCNQAFIDNLMKKNNHYPLGVEVYFINEKNELLALSRTTKVEVL